MYNIRHDSIMFDKKNLKNVGILIAKCEKWQQNGKFSKSRKDCYVGKPR